MKKILSLLVAILILGTFSNAFAKSPDFPEKGWHKGPYLVVLGGMTQAGHDRNQGSGVKFGSTFAPAVGFAFGWDILDWIGPQLTMRYGFDSGTTGIAGSATYPRESAKEHIVNVGLLARITFLTQWKNISDTFKILPYVKVGGTAHGLYVNAPTAANKAGAWGYGPALGAGIEGLIKDRFVIGIDVQEDLLFMQSVKKTVGGTPNTEILKGGFTPIFNLMGMVGYHF